MKKLKNLFLKNKIFIFVENKLKKLSWNFILLILILIVILIICLSLYRGWLITSSKTQKNIYDPPTPTPSLTGKKFPTAAFSQETNNEISILKDICNLSDSQAGKSVSFSCANKTNVNNSTVINNPTVINSFTITIPQPITDKKGNKLQTRLISFVKDTEWKLGSSSELEDNRKNLDLIIKDAINQLNTIKFFQRNKYLFAVGTASSEGIYPQEKARAFDRAKAIRMKINSLGLAPSKEFYLLNLGQYESNKCISPYSSTQYQRPVMLLGIVEGRDDYTKEELKEYLYSSLEKDNARNLGPSCYSDFELIPN